MKLAREHTELKMHTTDVCDVSIKLMYSDYFHIRKYGGNGTIQYRRPVFCARAILDFDKNKDLWANIDNQFIGFVECYSSYKVQFVYSSGIEVHDLHPLMHNEILMCKSDASQYPFVKKTAAAFITQRQIKNGGCLDIDYKDDSPIIKDYELQNQNRPMRIIHEEYVHGWLAIRKTHINCEYLSPYIWSLKFEIIVDENCNTRTELLSQPLCYFMTSNPFDYYSMLEENNKISEFVSIIWRPYRAAPIILKEPVICVWLWPKFVEEMDLPYGTNRGNTRLCVLKPNHICLLSPHISLTSGNARSSHSVQSQAVIHRIDLPSCSRETTIPQTGPKKLVKIHVEQDGTNPSIVKVVQPTTRVANNSFNEFEFSHLDVHLASDLVTVNAEEVHSSNELVYQRPTYKLFATFTFKDFMPHSYTNTVTIGFLEGYTQYHTTYWFGRIKEQHSLTQIDNKQMNIANKRRSIQSMFGDPEAKFVLTPHIIREKQYRMNYIHRPLFSDVRLKCEKRLTKIDHCEEGRGWLVACENGIYYVLKSYHWKLRYIVSFDKNNTGGLDVKMADFGCDFNPRNIMPLVLDPYITAHHLFCIVYKPNSSTSICLKYPDIFVQDWGTFLMLHKLPIVPRPDNFHKCDVPPYNFEISGMSHQQQANDTPARPIYQNPIRYATRSDFSPFHKVFADIPSGSQICSQSGSSGDPFSSYNPNQCSKICSPLSRQQEWNEQLVFQSQLPSASYANQDQSKVQTILQSELPSTSYAQQTPLEFQTSSHRQLPSTSYSNQKQLKIQMNPQSQLPSTALKVQTNAQSQLPGTSYAQQNPLKVRIISQSQLPSTSHAQQNPLKIQIIPHSQLPSTSYAEQNIYGSQLDRQQNLQPFANQFVDNMNFESKPQACPSNAPASQTKWIKAVQIVTHQPSSNVPIIQSAGNSGSSNKLLRVVQQINPSSFQNMSDGRLYEADRTGSSQSGNVLQQKTLNLAGTPIPERLDATDQESNKPSSEQNQRKIHNRTKWLNLLEKGQTKNMAKSDVPKMGDLFKFTNKKTPDNSESKQILLTCHNWNRQDESRPSTSAVSRPPQSPTSNMTLDQPASPWVSKLKNVYDRPHNVRVIPNSPIPNTSYKRAKRDAELEDVLGFMDEMQYNP